MTIEQAKRFIEDRIQELSEFQTRAFTAQRYYDLQNDVTLQKKDEDETSVRRADNRIASAFFPLLVDQKTAYLFTSPPLFDCGDEKTNKRVKQILGDDYTNKCASLGTYASIDGCAWIHYWYDADGGFKYGVIRGTQILPVYTNDLEQKLEAVVRTYVNADPEDGKTYCVFEFWDDTECYACRYEQSAGLSGLTEYGMFRSIDALTNTELRRNVMRHGMGEVPFLPFGNNSRRTGDLTRIKGLIDAYDKTFNGFLNDLEDVQEIILILREYDGTDLGSFLNDLKTYKTIKVSDGGGVDTLNIQIPVEARDKMLEITKKAIYKYGQGVDPEPEVYGNASGVALQFMYSLLELKAGQQQMEFMPSLYKLIRAICRSAGLAIRGDNIIQTWTRTEVRSDAELASIASQSQGMLSRKTILKNHPFVEDADAELEQIEEEAEGLGHEDEA